MAPRQEVTSQRTHNYFEEKLYLHSILFGWHSKTNKILFKCCPPNDFAGQIAKLATLIRDGKTKFLIKLHQNIAISHEIRLTTSWFQLFDLHVNKRWCHGGCAWWALHKPPETGGRPDAEQVGIFLHVTYIYSNTNMPILQCGESKWRESCILYI